MHAKQWLAAYAEQLGVDPPTAAEIKAVLDLAAEAAHASERVAAPVACWLSARAGRSLDESLALARKVASAGERGRALADACGPTNEEGPDIRAGPTPV
jgi:hypothetical protein